MKKGILSILGIFSLVQVVAQENGDTHLPLYQNNQVKKQWAIKANAPIFLGKTGVKDTLTLPFFDDFSALGVLPNDTLWSDAAVFINADFAINPPSIGVATFDGLNAQGNAYGGVDVNIFGAADTLSSQPINLSSYVPADSLYLSFFYQAQGLSFESLKPSDSLVLQFRNRIGAWVNVWSSQGIPQADFKAVCIAVKDTSYLHSGFRFRWLNYQQFIGNLKQWHIDYVYLNQGRNSTDTMFEDQAVVYLPEFPFNTYTHIPWKQLQLNFGNHIKSSYDVQVQNLSNSGETFTVSMRVNDQNGEVGQQTLGGQSLPANTFQTYTLSPVISLSTNTQDSAELRLVTKISDILGGNTNRRNDSAVRHVELANYYAYDDGTAESGYGIRNGAGSVAYGFNLEAGDSIRGIWMHFTQAEVPNTGRFALKVWQTIAPVGQQSSGIDVELYSLETGVARYADSINGFYFFEFDSAIYVSGRFYIGWTQNSSFLMNIGLDRNYLHNGNRVPNPNLVYNTNGTWRNASVPGTIMMRPVVGDKWPTPLSNPSIPGAQTLTVYPNPALDRFYIKSESPIESIVMYDMKGQLIQNWTGNEGQYSLNSLSHGIYMLRVQMENGLIFTEKLIIQN